MPAPLRLMAATGDDVALIEVRDGTTAAAEIVLVGVGAQCLAVDPHDPARAIVGTFDRGAYRTRDGGRSWDPIGQALPHQRVLAVAISPCDRVGGRSVLYAGTEPSMLFRSDDDGARWQPFPALAELPSAPTWSFPPRPWTHHVRWIAPHPLDPATLYVGIELGGVMVSRDGGQTWEDRKPGSQFDAHALATHLAAPDRVYEAAGGGVAVSDDAGATWRAADEGMDRHYAWGLAVDADDPALWYVSASFGAYQAHRGNGDAQAVLFRRRRREPWQPLGGPGTGLERLLPFMPYALLAPKGRPKALVAGMQNGDLFVTGDAGDTWRRLATGLDRLLTLGEVPT